jgi:hypothetical protein
MFSVNSVEMTVSPNGKKLNQSTTTQMPLNITKASNM